MKLAVCSLNFSLVGFVGHGNSKKKARYVVQSNALKWLGLDVPGNKVLYSHGFHMDRKTGEIFSSQAIVNRLEKSGDFTQNTGKVREF